MSGKLLMATLFIGFVTHWRIEEKCETNYYQTLHRSISPKTENDLGQK